MPGDASLADDLGTARLRLEAALDHDDLRPLFAPLGYDAPVLQALLDAVGDVEVLARRQTERYAAQYQATAECVAAFRALRRSLQHHRRLARIALDASEPAYRLLGLDAPRAESYPGVIHQALAFYGRLHERPDLGERLRRYSVTDDVVAAALDAVRDLQSAKTRQTSAMQAAQAATRRRNEAATALRARLADFREIIDIATDDRPQLREALGIVTPRR